MKIEALLPIIGSSCGKFNPTFSTTQVHGPHGGAYVYFEDLLVFSLSQKKKGLLVLRSLSASLHFGLKYFVRNIPVLPFTDLPHLAFDPCQRKAITITLPGKGIIARSIRDNAIERKRRSSERAVTDRMAQRRLRQRRHSAPCSASLSTHSGCICSAQSSSLLSVSDFSFRGIPSGKRDVPSAVTEQEIRWVFKNGS